MARDLHKSFGTGLRRHPVLRGVSLTVNAGETVYLVGRSGSGKTTLLSILGAILTPDRGSIQVLGRETASMTAAERTAFRRQRVGFVFQTLNLFPTLSALDNILLALAVLGVPRKAAYRRAEDLLRQVGLEQQAHGRPAQLSTGECQRVAIARALAAEPAVLFADEPTASLDADNGQAVMRPLTELVRARGLALVVVTHDNRIFPFADRILQMEDGQLARESTFSGDELFPGFVEEMNA